MFEVALPDGGRVMVRPVVPTDKAHLLAGFAHLSERSRFFRFLGAIDRLSPSDLDRFTAAGDEGHRAYGALDLSASPPLPVGIARYERLAEEPAQSEMAVTVIDSHQGRGIGTLLIGAIAYCAVRAGIATFVAFVHPENRGMAGLITALGGAVVERGDSETVFHLPLHGDPDRYPSNRSGDSMRSVHRLMARD